MPTISASISVLRLLLICFAVLSLSACATRPATSGWGGGASLTPGWGKVGDAFVAAATDPFTWAPAAGALVLGVSGADKDVSRWARRHTPVYGSRGNASDASDLLREISFGGYLLTGLAAPVGAGENPVVDKVKGFGVGFAAIAATELITRQGKAAIGRERPLDQNDQSLPSRHTSLTAVSARLTRETLRYYDMPRGARIAADAGLAGMTAMTGWARVEAGVHYPSDVLAGAALGNFLAVFATEAFLHPESGLALRVDPMEDGLAVTASIAF
ncbi:MAG TPA: phosphatase PAP2 family protein [Thermohalobaculum sp.]|nr:phosphatase PAP2 family protein [Thermohalobaculum sp.]